MENDIKVSVYCLAYNHEKYIRNTLDGFVNQQTDFPYEVIVHDDASTDGTAAIIAEYAEKYPDIIKPVYQSENQFSKGKGIVRPFVLPYMKGTYIASCEGDDYWTAPDKLQKQADFLDSHPNCFMVTHNTERITADNEHIDYMVRKEGDGYLSPAELINKNKKNPHFSSLMYRRAFWDEGQPDFFELITGDNRLRYYAAAKGDIYYIDEVMSAYRVSTPGSWTSRQRKNRSARVKTEKNMLLFLEQYDTYTNGKYHDAVVREKDKREFALKLAERDYKAAYELSKVRNISIKLRIGLLLLSKFPFLQKLKESIKE